jgi:hypothetical protein
MDKEFHSLSDLSKNGSAKTTLVSCFPEMILEVNGKTPLCTQVAFIGI